MLKLFNTRMIPAITHSVNGTYLREYLESPRRLAIASGLLTMALSIFFLRDGLKITVDGWGYWESSVSLLNGDGFHYFGGQPVVVFGPLFPVYLASVQKIFGVSGGSLVVGFIILAVLTSSAWSYLFSSLSNRSNHQAATKRTIVSYQHLIFPIYVSTFISFYYRFLLSEALFLLLLALLFIAITQIALKREHKSHLWRQMCYLNVVLVLLLFTRNSAWVFVPGVVVVLFFTLDHKKWIQRIVLSSFPLLFALISWGSLRQLLRQRASHTFKLGGNYTPGEYLTQILAGLAEMLGPKLYGIDWLVLLLIGVAMLWLSTIMKQHLRRKIDVQQIALIQIFSITISGLGGLYVLFNLTHIHDQLAWRFLWFFILGIVGVWATYATWLPTCKGKRFLSTVLLIVVSLQIARTGVHTIKIALGQSFPLPDVALEQTIRSDYITGDPIKEGNLTLVAPPDFEWLDRRYNERAK